MSKSEVWDQVHTAYSTGSGKTEAWDDVHKFYGGIATSIKLRQRGLALTGLRKIESETTARNAKRMEEAKKAPKVADSSDEVKANSARVVARQPAEYKSGQIDLLDIEKVFLTQIWDATAKPVDPIDRWLKIGKKIITNAIIITASDIVSGTLTPSSYFINVPLGKMIPKEYIIGKGAWNQGEEVGISFDSPDVAFDDEDNLVGARIGIHWTKKNAPEDKKGEPWWGCIRLAVEVSKDGKETWKTHARVEYEKADDERVDNYVEKRIKALDKGSGYSGNALETLKKADAEVVRVMEAKKKK
jgi:hypothetical protein